MSWELMFGVGVVLLFGALVYGMVQYRTRNRANDRVTEKATKTVYDDPAYSDEKRRDLQKELRPSR